MNAILQVHYSDAMVTWRDLIVYLAYVLGTVPIILYLSKREKHKDIRFLVPFIYLSVASVIYEIIATEILSVNSTIWFKVYTLLEFLSLYYFFKFALRNSATLVNTFLIGFVLAFLSLQVHWFMGGNANTDSSLITIEALLVYIGSFIWFKQTFTDMNLKTLWNSPTFFFISGFVLFFSGTLFLFLMSDIVFTQKEVSRYWIINVILSIVLYISISIGIWIGQQKSPQYSG